MLDQNFYERRHFITGRDVAMMQLPNSRHRRNIAWRLSKLWAFLLGLRHP
jgi:hypothetical protein